MGNVIDEQAPNAFLRQARTHNDWIGEPVGADLFRKVWDLARMGLTSANCSTARIVFVVSPEAKRKLKPCLIEGNVDKSMASPATAVIVHDLAFTDRLLVLFSYTDARSWFAGNPKLIKTTAFRNGTLQGTYFIHATRAMGLGCGPMSGFDNAKVDDAFFAGTTIRSNFLCNLGYGDPEKLRPRSPRLAFDEACEVV